MLNERVNNYITLSLYRKIKIKNSLHWCHCKFISVRDDHPQMLQKELFGLAHWPSGYSVHQWSGRPGFNPRSRHTKDFKNGTLYLLA